MQQAVLKLAENVKGSDRNDGKLYHVNALEENISFHKALPTALQSKTTQTQNNLQFVFTSQILKPDMDNLRLTRENVT